MKSFHLGCKPQQQQHKINIQLRKSLQTRSQAATQIPQQQKQQSQGKQKSAFVVGGGVGGLVCAGLLAKNGIKTTIIEKNDEVGGRMQSEVYGGARFDTGPSLLIFPGSYRTTYELLGENFDDHVNLLRVEPQAYRVYQEDNSFIDILYDMQKMTQQLDDIEKGAGTAYMEWLNTARIMYDFGWPAFIESDLQTIQDIPKALKIVPQALRVNLLDILDKHFNRMKGRFKDPRLRSFITFQDLYIGLSPYNAPSVYSLLAGGEVTEGVWYPEGGFQKVRDTLKQIVQKLGVEIKVSQQVEYINVQEKENLNQKTQYEVQGVKVNGQDLLADIVVTNIDVPQNYTMLQNGMPRDNGNTEEIKQKQKLMKEYSGNSNGQDYEKNQYYNSKDIYSYQKEQTDKYDKMEYSNAVISFYWTVKGEHHQLKHHNVFLSGDYEQAWQPARTAEELRSRPNFYVCCPKRTDQSVAPDNVDSIMVLFPISCLQNTTYENHDQMVQAAKEKVLQAFDQVGAKVRNNITNEVIRRPKEWEELYNLKYGAAFGLAHGLNQLAIFRPAVKEEFVDGLYRTGASTRPGNGVPLCMNSGKHAARAVLREQINVALK